MLEGIKKNLGITIYLLISGSLLFTSCTNNSSEEKGKVETQTVEESEAGPASALNADTIYYSEVPGAIKIVREKITKETDAVEVDKKVKAYQKEIEKIKKKYLNLKYSYIPGAEGKIQSVGGNYSPLVEGLEDSLEIERLTLLLEVWGTDRNRVREYKNAAVKVEKEARPVMGYEKLYEKILSNINYPDEAKEQGIEGTAFIEFDVNENGQVKNVVVVDTDYDSKSQEIISKLNTQAKDAIMATSGDWVPAKQGDQAIATTLEIPVTFDFKKL